MAYENLFNYMSKEHGLNLLQEEMQEIERIVKFDELEGNCNKPHVSSCCRKKIPLINKASVSRSIYSIKDPKDIEYKIYEAGFKAGIKQFRLLNNC